MKIKIMKTLLSVAVFSAMTNSAWAAPGETTAGTDVDNLASITYTVSGTNETIKSSPTGNSDIVGGGGAGAAGTTTTFKVDKKIDLTVTTGGSFNVAPNTTGTTITFTVQNTGNSDEDFDLSQTQVAGDDFDATACSITTPAALPIAIARDTTQNVTVTCNIPSSVVNTDTSLIDLKATAVDGSGAAYVESAGEAAATIDVVLADDGQTTSTATDTGSETVAADNTAGNGNRNASHSATSTFLVHNAAANITVTKTSAVTADPVNGVSASAKRIPGATIVYTITVSNAPGATDATSLVITDALDTDLDYVSCAPAGDALVAPTCSTSVTGGITTVATTGFTLPGAAPAPNVTPKVETLTITATVK